MPKLIASISEENRRQLHLAYNEHRHLSKSEVLDLVIREGTMSLLAGNPPTDPPEETEEDSGDGPEAEE